MLGSASTRVTAFAFGLALAFGAAPTMASAQASEAAESAEAHAPVQQLADWVMASGDNQALPFVIIDKTAARVFVFDAEGEQLGETAALIGLQPGDDSAPGIGDRELSDMPPEERTTPAGRFLGGYGPAADGRDVLWVDFATAISLHAVVTTRPEEQRVQRLKTPAIDDNRITYGCINVPKKFYRDVVRPVLSKSNGVFYILPDTRPLSEVFPSFGVQLAQSGQAAGSP